MVIKETRQAHFKRNTLVVPGYFAYYPYYKGKGQINFIVCLAENFPLSLLQDHYSCQVDSNVLFHIR